MPSECLMNVQFMSCVQGVLRIITVTIRFFVFIFTWWLAPTFSYLALICIDSFIILITRIIARPMKKESSSSLWCYIHSAYSFDIIFLRKLSQRVDGFILRQYIRHCICNFEDAKIIYFLEKNNCILLFFSIPTSISCENQLLLP